MLLLHPKPPLILRLLPASRSATTSISILYHPPLLHVQPLDSLGLLETGFSRNCFRGSFENDVVKLLVAALLVVLCLAAIIGLYDKSIRLCRAVSGSQDLWYDQRREQREQSRNRYAQLGLGGCPT